MRTDEESVDYEPDFWISFDEFDEEHGKMDLRLYLHKALAYSDTVPPSGQEI